MTVKCDKCEETKFQPLCINFFLIAPWNKIDKNKVDGNKVEKGRKKRNSMKKMNRWMYEG